MDDMERIIVVFGTLENGDLWKGHFGDAEFFTKYDFFPGGAYEFTGRIKNLKKNEGEKHGSTEKMQGVKGLLSGCDCVAACVMSPNFRKMAENTVIQPVVVKGCENAGNFIKKIAYNYTLISSKVAGRKAGVRDTDIPVF
ncbi:MAG TPA: hypothetical protein ENN43_02150 [bacterium]|nr:hypothetical protein [bacterium]